MLKRANKRGDRSRGLFAPPKRLSKYRDPIRCFTGQTLASLFKPRGYACFNPYCDFRELPLQAHHIFAHALGGRSVPNNAIILCSSCHAIVHRGVIPLEILLEWKKGDLKDTENFISNADELWSLVRSVPLSETLGGHDRLVELNKYLLHVNNIKDLNTRNFIFGEIMLAKAAVLNDSYRDVGSNINSATEAMKVRHKRILPFGSAAKYFGNKISSPAITARALHYRSIAYETSGSMSKCLQMLREAWRVCERFSPDGNPKQFHELSTPSRILRATALARAKLGGSRSQAQKEYERGLHLLEKFGESAAWDEARMRHVQLELLLGNYNEAEAKLDRLWDEILELDHNSRLIAQRLQIELLINKKERGALVKPLIDAALQEAATYRLYRQEHHIYRLSRQLAGT